MVFFPPIVTECLIRRILWGLRGWLIALTVLSKDPSLVSCTHSSQSHSVSAVLDRQVLYLSLRIKLHPQALGLLRVQSMVAEKAWQSEWHVVVLVEGGLSCLGTTDRPEGKPGL